MPIVKHNKLIETSYKLNSREQFFVLYLISRISQNSKDFQEYTMHYSEIESIINFDGKRRIANKSEVFKLMDKLNSDPIVYEKGSVVGKSVWLQHMEHNTETDEFTFSLSEKLKDYLIQLKEHFTKYSLSNIVYLGAHSMRIYELLKRHEFKGECILPLDKMKFYLGIENRYPKYYEFKRWVLFPSQREIEEHTDIRFEFEPAKKEGRRVLSLRFKIYENEPKRSPETLKLVARLEGKEEVRFSRKNSTKTKDKIAKLAYYQLEAFHFLAEHNINKVFILDKILKHPKVQYEPLRGYEDIYARLLWSFFLKKTNAKEKAGAFVNWWNNGRFTEESTHVRFLELVIERKQRMGQKVVDQRNISKDMTASEFSDFLKKEAEKPTNKPLNRSFRFPVFQETEAEKMNTILEDLMENNPEKYEKLFREVVLEYETAFHLAEQEFDLNRHEKAIRHKIYNKLKSPPK